MARKKLLVPKTRRLRRVFGILFLLALLFGPPSLYAIQNLASSDQIIQVVNGEVDASNKPNIGSRARYIHGEVEFYYNTWLYSETPSTPATPSYLPTPGYWTGKGDGYSSDGYASYRYVLTGLTPETELRVYSIIDIPNRVYLNGNLCSEVGYPSKSRQSSLVDLSHKISRSYIVPSDGIVEYVMEVGNTGSGGAQKIGTVVLKDAFAGDLNSLSFALMAAGGITGVLVFLGVAVWLARRKALIFPLGALSLSALLFLGASFDSPLVGANFFYGGRSFMILAIVSIFLMILSTLSYERLTRRKVLYFGERIFVISLGTISSIGAIATLSMDISILPYAALSSIPVYLCIRHIVHYARNEGNLKPTLLYASIGSLAVFNLIVHSRAGFLYPFGYPSVLSFALCLIALGIAFHEIYYESFSQMDKAILARRYRQVSSRALSRAGTASEAVMTLDYIGKGYDKSLRVGDKRLLVFSQVTRKRLLALREDSISLEEECELEGQLFDLRQAVNGGQGSLILDVEESSKRVPPLLFEGCIVDLSKRLKDGESIILGESKRGVVLTYPKRLRINPSVIAALKERIGLVGLCVKNSNGKVEVFRRLDR